MVGLVARTNVATLPRACAGQPLRGGPNQRCSSGTMTPHRATPRASHWVKFGSVTEAQSKDIWLN